MSWSSTRRNNEKFHRSPLASAPAFLLLLCFSSFIYLYVGFALPFAASALTALLIPTGWGLFGTTRLQPSIGTVAAWLFLIGLLGIGIISREAGTQAPINERVEATAAVLSSRDWGFGSVALVRSRASRSVYLLKFDGNPPKPGDLVSFSGTLMPFKRAADRGFDEFLYWRAKGALGYIENPQITRLGTANGFPRWRLLLSERIRETLPPLTASYMLAITTGGREGSIESLHRSAGTSHLLAVSGFHVGIVWAVAWLIFRRFRHRLIVISICIWLYTLLSGAAPSALRAAFMIQLVILGRMAGRGKGNSFNTVSVAGVILLLLNPWLFWNIGWRLSMLAALSITSISGLSSETPLARTLLAGSLVWLATSLQASWTFDSVPLVGLLLNFIALPVFSFLYPLAIALSAPALLGLPLGYALALLPEFFFRRWETFSANALFLLPQKVAFSSAMLLFGATFVVFFFACACGFSKWRALFGSALTTSMAFFLLAFVI